MVFSLGIVVAGAPRSGKAAPEHLAPGPLRRLGQVSANLRRDIPASSSPTWQSRGHGTARVRPPSIEKYGDHVNVAPSASSVVRRYFDMWNTGDTTAAAAILHPDWVDHAHPEVAGPEGVRQSVAAVRAARPNLRFHVEAVLGDGDLVAVVGGVGDEARDGGAPGRLVWLVRVRDGRMVEMWTYRPVA
jgi:ketosteroid isomerase-like protein